MFRCLPPRSIARFLLIAGAATGVACRDIAADGFPASVGHRCPGGFRVADDRCYRGAPDASPGTDASAEGTAVAGTDAGRSADGPLAPPVPASSCPPDTRLCPDRACRANDVAACGDSCQSCTAPPNATPSCDRARCSFTCTDGFIKCDDRCFGGTAARPPCCVTTDCPAREGGTASCGDHTCFYLCTPGYLSCDGVCITPANPACCGAQHRLDSDGNGIFDCTENLIANGQFAKDTTNWETRLIGSGMAEWSPMDAQGAASSGSLKATATCPDVANCGSGPTGPFLPGAGRYTIDLEYFIPPGQSAQGAAEVGVAVEEMKGASFLGRRIGAWTRGQLTVQVVDDPISSLFLAAHRESQRSPFVVFFDNILVRRAP